MGAEFFDSSVNPLALKPVHITAQEHREGLIHGATLDRLHRCGCLI